jgi:CheY-like chemotaxis protein
MGIVCSMSILIVDDEPQIRALLADILTEEGYTVDTATNGQDAINYLQTTGVPPCMIVLDLMMPIMDGWQFRAIQQHDPTLAQIPVVVISARPDLVRAATSLGVTEVLSKPIDLDSLLTTVERYCASS